MHRGNNANEIMNESLDIFSRIARRKVSYNFTVLCMFIKFMFLYDKE
jgi:hypothetical protein